MQHPRHETDLDPAVLWMQQLAALPSASASFPTAESLWWRAEALRRLDEQRRLTARLEIGERIQVGCVAAAALVFLVWMLTQSTVVWERLALSAAGALLIAIGALLALDSRRRNWAGPQR